jgi:AbrB family looped-hinge helix DNA binding protein
MSKVTSKLQVTIPKALAERYGIASGDEIEWEAAAEAMRIVPAGRARKEADPRSRLKRFDEATARRDERQTERTRGRSRARGWKREDLYERARPR